jgi:Tfp pilus assembly protein PilF
LLLVGGIGLGVCIATIRPADLRLSTARLFSSLAGGQPNSNRPNAVATSDSEKSLARDLYLKGRYEWNQRTADSLNRALDSFTQALVHDPGNARAYVGLADTYNLLREFATMPESEAYARALRGQEGGATR